MRSLFSQLSSTENVSPSHRITARSITFCNSRTFPGQLYPLNSLRDFLSMVVNFFPALFPKRSMKYSTSKGMSASRSRNGGISIGTTLSRYREILAKFAFRNERVQIAMSGRQHSNVNGNRPVACRRARFHVPAGPATVRFGFQGAGRRLRLEKLSRHSPIQNARGAVALRR